MRDLAGSVYRIMLQHLLLNACILLGHPLLLSSLLPASIVIHKSLLGRVRRVNLPLQVVHAHQIHLLLGDAHQILGVDGLELILCA